MITIIYVCFFQLQIQPINHFGNEFKNESSDVERVQQFHSFLIYFTLNKSACGFGIYTCLFSQAYHFVRQKLDAIITKLGAQIIKLPLLHVYQELFVQNHCFGKFNTNNKQK